MSYCESCDRGFVSEAALERHIRDSSRHAYCTRCERPFGSLESLQQHVRNSSSHHICSDCSIEDDFPTSADLEKHRETVHHLCSRCNRRFDTAGQLSQHNISRHNMCIVCRTCIDSQHNLRAHLRTHEAKNTVCFGCPKKFSSSAAMVLHFEQGACESWVDKDCVTNLALECYQSHYYECEDPEYVFKCPTCESGFMAMSALLQHVESDFCNESLAPGTPLSKFLRFLQSRV